jgi:hypothetical protein
MRSRVTQVVTKQYILLCSVLCLAVLVAGCGGGGGKGTVDQGPPTVTIASYTGLVPATGGAAIFDIVAIDDVGVTRVEVKVTKPDGTSEIINAAKSGNVWRAQFNAPPNVGTQAAVYKFVAYAYDAVGNVGSSTELSFRVSAPDVPPPPPPFVTGS